MLCVKLLSQVGSTHRVTNPERLERIKYSLKYLPAHIILLLAVFVDEIHDVVMYYIDIAQYISAVSKHYKYMYNISLTMTGIMIEKKGPTRCFND